MRYIKVGLIVLILCMSVICLIFPIRNSREYTQAFLDNELEDYLLLVRLLYDDYSQHAIDNDTICYRVLYENNIATSIKRLRIQSDKKVIDEDVMLKQLAAFPETLLPRIELIYVSPNEVSFCSHMAVKYILYQKKGIPLSFFFDEGNNDYRLFRLTDHWYYAYTTAK